MDTRRSPGGGSRVGYLLNLIGTAAFAASCFLPFYSVHVDDSLVLRHSLYKDFSTSGKAFAYVGTWLFLFGGAAIVACVSIVGLRQDPPRWTPVALVAAAGAWSVSMIGLLLFVPQGLSVEIGYWCLLLSVGVVMAGAIVVFASARARAGAEARNTTES